MEIKLEDFKKVLGHYVHGAVVESANFGNTWCVRSKEFPDNFGSGSTPEEAMLNFFLDMVKSVRRLQNEVNLLRAQHVAK